MYLRIPNYWCPEIVWNALKCHKVSLANSYHRIKCLHKWFCEQGKVNIILTLMTIHAVFHWIENKKVTNYVHTINPSIPVMLTWVSWKYIVPLWRWVAAEETVKQEHVLYLRTTIPFWRRLAQTKCRFWYSIKFCSQRRAYHSTIYSHSYRQ